MVLDAGRARKYLFGRWVVFSKKKASCLIARGESNLASQVQTRKNMLQPRGGVGRARSREKNFLASGGGYYRWTRICGVEKSRGAEGSALEHGGRCGLVGEMVFVAFGWKR